MAPKLKKTIWHNALTGFFLLVFLLFFLLQGNAQVKEEALGLKRHLVGSHETFYSISRAYSVSISDLKAANPGMSYPKAGEYILIPKGNVSAPDNTTNIIPLVTETEGEVAADCRKDRKNLSSTYKVALMLPLSLEDVPSIDTLLTRSPAEAMSIPSLRFLQFYQGFLMAADTLSDQGLQLELTVIDSDQDQSKANKAISSGSLKDMDLIVGPFYKNAFSETASYAQKHGIPIVNPLSAREDILAGNPNVFKLAPSRSSQVEVLVSLVGRKFRDHNIIIVTENSIQGAGLVGSLSSGISEIVKKSVPFLNYATDSLPGVRQLLRDEEANLVIMYSETGVLPVQLLPWLSETSREKEITIIGMPEWEKFDQIENKYLISLKSYLLSDSYVDYFDTEVKGFISEFRRRYQAEPLAYAYAGYDAAMFFLSSMMDYGHDFADCVKDANYPLLHTRYIFKKVPGGGYDNVYWNIYYFQDFFLIKVPYTLKSSE